MIDGSVGKKNYWIAAFFFLNPDRARLLFSPPLSAHSSRWWIDKYSASWLLAVYTHSKRGIRSSLSSCWMLLDAVVCCCILSSFDSHELSEAIRMAHCILTHTDRSSTDSLGVLSSLFTYRNELLKKILKTFGCCSVLYENRERVDSGFFFIFTIHCKHQADVWWYNVVVIVRYIYTQPAHL